MTNVHIIHTSSSRFPVAPTFLLLALFILTVAAHGQQPAGAKQNQLFDNDWKFHLGDSSAFASPGFPDNTWRLVNLPHDWSIEGQVNPHHPTQGGGGYFPAGIGWYRKTFHVPADWKGQSVAVYFEGVYRNGEVFINGHSLGVYPYGYSSFEHQLSPYLKFGQDNVLAVRVDNAQQMNSRWYSGSGIYRHVWLTVTGPLHIARWGVAISTPIVSSKKATVLMKTIIQNQSDAPQKMLLNTQIITPDHQKKGNTQTAVVVAANGQTEVVQHIHLTSPLLWSTETPHLYTAQSQLIQDKNVQDDLQTSFGVRSITFSAVAGFQLNGKQVKINGGCVHHDNGCLGAAAFDRAEERKVALLKSAGFNAVRTSHNPPSEAFLRACDRLGLLVMDESFDCWTVGKNKHDYASDFKLWWQRDLEAMIRRDYNHPSIIMWSIGNEIPERGSRHAIETAAMLIHAIKKIDSSRPVTSAVVANEKKWSAFDSLFSVHDVAGYNYHLSSAPDDHQRVPQRMVVHTESYPKDAFTNWKLVQEHPYILGDFVWTAMDYLGEAGIGRWYYSGETPGEHWEHDFFPWHGAYCGDIDLMGQRKPISHYRNLLYNRTEKLYMAVREPEPAPLEIKETWWSVWPTWAHWTWPGWEGKKIQVEVYSAYPSVQLYLNDLWIGEQPTTQAQGYKTTFTVPYAPGKLKAVGIDNQQAVETTALQTAGDATTIKLVPDRLELQADGQDLCYVAVEITDAQGVLQPQFASRLAFKIEGPATIIGTDNADLRDTDIYTHPSRRAWKGRALVVIRSSRKPGNIKLTVTSPGLAPASLTLTSTDARR